MCTSRVGGIRVSLERRIFVRRIQSKRTVYAYILIIRLLAVDPRRHCPCHVAQLRMALEQRQLIAATLCLERSSLAVYLLVQRRPCGTAAACSLGRYLVSMGGSCTLNAKRGGQKYVFAAQNVYAYIAGRNLLVRRNVFLPLCALVL